MKRHKQPVTVVFEKGGESIHTEQVLFGEKMLRDFQNYAKEKGITLSEAINERIWLHCFKDFPTRVPDWVIYTIIYLVSGWLATTTIWLLLP